MLLATAESEVSDKVLVRDTTFQLDMDTFPFQRTGAQAGSAAPIIFPLQSLKQVTQIDYIDPDDTPQTVASYAVVSGIVPGYVRPAFGETWPLTRAAFPGNVQITFQAGPNTEQLQIIRAVLLQLVSTWFETRSGAFTGTVSTEMKLSTRDLMDHLNWGNEFFNFDTMHYGSV